MSAWTPGTAEVTARIRRGPVLPDGLRDPREPRHARRWGDVMDGDDAHTVANELADGGDGAMAEAPEAAGSDEAGLATMAGDGGWRRLLGATRRVGRLGVGPAGGSSPSANAARGCARRRLGARSVNPQGRAERRVGVRGGGSDGGATGVDHHSERRPRRLRSRDRRRPTSRRRGRCRHRQRRRRRRRHRRLLRGWAGERPTMCRVRRDTREGAELSTRLASSSAPPNQAEESAPVQPLKRCCITL